MVDVGVVDVGEEVETSSNGTEELEQGPRDPRSWWFLVAAGIAVGVVLLVGVRAAVDGWLPVGDEGFFALRAHDVFSHHPPLIGTASSASTYSDAPTSHPGPLQFFALALPVAVLGVGVGTVIGTALINGLAVGGAIALVRSRLGVVAGSAAAVAFAGLAWAMGSVILHDPWGPFAIILPFGLFVVAVGIAAGGEARTLPVVALAGSLVLQTHASYVLLVPGLAALAVGGVLINDRTRATVRWIAISAGVTLLCWIPPILQQLRNEPGNLVALWRAAHAEGPGTVTAQQAVYLVSGTVALPPFWFAPGFEDASPLYNHLSDGQRTPVGNIAAVLLISLLGIATRSAWKRRDRIVLGALATSVVGLALAWLSIKRAPAYGVWGVSYIRFLWPLSLWVWFSLGLAAVRSWSRPRIPSRVVLPALTALVVVIALATIPQRDTSVVERDGWQERAHPIVDAVVAAVDDLHGPVLLHQTVTEANFTYGPLLMAELAQRNIPFLVDDPTLIRQVGAHRAATPQNEPAAVLQLVQIPDDTINGGTILYQDDGLSPAEARELDKLTDQLTRQAERHAATDEHLTLSPQANAYVKEVHPEKVATVRDKARTRPLTPRLLAEIDDTVGGRPLRWSNGEALDQRKVQRWAELDDRHSHNQVVVYLRKITKG